MEESGGTIDWKLEMLAIMLLWLRRRRRVQWKVMVCKDHSVKIDNNITLSFPLNYQMLVAYNYPFYIQGVYNLQNGIEFGVDSMICKLKGKYLSLVSCWCLDCDINKIG